MRNIGTGLFTIAEASALTGKTEETIKTYCTRRLERDRDYVTHRWQTGPGGRWLRHQRLITAEGVRRLQAQAYGRLYLRSLERAERRKQARALAPLLARRRTPGVG